jgi:FKBP-type peptidyl-prolyl cis-trans isomerase
MSPLKNTIFFLVMLTLVSCGGEVKQEKDRPVMQDYEEPLIEANRHVVKTENQHIEDFLRRYKWEMEETGSGLRYMIYHDVEGRAAKKGMLAQIDYSVRLITGDEVYSSEEEGPLSFVIGNGEVISGLEEGILFMDIGDKAKFIIPSHLAYGLVGDGNRIPAKTTLIYEVELLNLSQTNE